MISDNETSFLHKFLLTNREVSNLRKAFADISSTDFKLSKNQISKMIQSREFLGRFLGSLLKTGLLLMKNVIKPYPKSVIIHLGLTAAASAGNAGIRNIILGSGTTTLITWNDEMKKIIRVVKSLENSGLLLKGVSETIQNEAKEQNWGFLSMLLGKVDETLPGNILADRGTNRAWEGVIRAGYWNKRHDHDFHETPNMYPNLNAVPLSDQQHFRLNKVNEIKDYFVAEIKARKSMSKRLSKDIASFEYFDKSLIALSITTGSISIA